MNLEVTIWKFSGNGKWYFSLFTPANQLVATSDKSWDSREDAEEAVREYGLE